MWLPKKAIKFSFQSFHSIRCRGKKLRQIRKFVFNDRRERHGTLVTCRIDRDKIEENLNGREFRTNIPDVRGAYCIIRILMYAAGRRDYI